MKTYKGTAKVKNDSTYVYKGHTFEVTGVYLEYKNGNGNGIYADGTRDYKLSLKGTEFEGDRFGTMTVIHDSHLEDIELFETLVLPLNEQETLALIEFTRDRNATNEDMLKYFIEENTKNSELPIPDLTTLYDEGEFRKRNNLK